MKKLCLLALLFATACDRAPAAGAAPSAETTSPPPSAAPLATAKPKGPSVYELELALTDQDGAALSLDAFRGRPVVLSMFYGTCPYACPTLISDIKRALAQLEPDQRAEYRVLLVSFDPDRDTPKALKGLADLHQVDQPEWRFTRAADGMERDLAAVLGIKYKKLPSGGIQHTSLISVLDARGVVRHRSESSPDADEAALVRALRATASETAPQG